MNIEHLQNNVNIIVKRNRKSTMKNLLNGTNESFYWIGFLLADGAFYKNYRVRLVLSKKDMAHLYKYAEYIESDVKVYTFQEYDYAYVASMDKLYVSMLMDRFDIHPNKTYHPPNIEVFKHLSFEENMSMICGFIDGDGCIKHQYNRPDSSMMIKLHHTWKVFLQYILDFININFHKTKSKITITKCSRYAYLVISDNDILNRIKNFAILKELPIMTRKWDNIQYYETRTSKALYKRNKILDYIKIHPYISVKKISDELEIPYSTVYSILKRLDRC